MGRRGRLQCNKREIIEMRKGNEKRKRPKGHKHVSGFKKGCFNLNRTKVSFFPQFSITACSIFAQLPVN